MKAHKKRQKESAGGLYVIAFIAVRFYFIQRICLFSAKQLLQVIQYGHKIFLRKIILKKSITFKKKKKDLYWGFSFFFINFSLMSKDTWRQYPHSY